MATLQEALDSITVGMTVEQLKAFSVIYWCLF